MKFRKRTVDRKGTVEVDAVQWFPGSDGTIRPLLPKTASDQQRVCAYCNLPLGVHGWVATCDPGTVCPGDWLVTGAEGEQYLCKPHAFANWFEPAP